MSLSRRELLSAAAMAPFCSAAFRKQLDAAGIVADQRIVVPTATKLRGRREALGPYAVPSQPESFDLDLRMEAVDGDLKFLGGYVVTRFGKMFVEFDLPADPRDLTFPEDGVRPLVYAILTDVEVRTGHNGGFLNYGRLWGPKYGLETLRQACRSGNAPGFSILSDFHFENQDDDKPLDIYPVELIGCRWLECEDFREPIGATTSTSESDRIVLATRVSAEYGKFAFDAFKQHKELEFDWGRDV